MAVWKEYKIGDLCDTISETYRGHDEEVILINTSDVLEGRILNHQKVPNRNVKGQFKKTFKTQDILYSEIRPENNRFAYVDMKDTSLYIASTKLMVIRANIEIIEPRFLYAILTAKSMTQELQVRAELRSGTFPQITFKAELATIKVCVPDRKTQKKIVSFLDAINRKIEVNNKINRNLSEQAKILYKEWFIDFGPFEGEMPGAWHLGTVEEIIELHDSKRKPLSGRQRDDMEKIYPYYGATSIMDYVDNYIFDGIYLLLGEDGSVIDTEGYPILQYVFGKFWPNNHAHVITGKNGFSVEMLYLLFSLTNVQNIVTGAVQLKISQQNLKTVEVVVPSYEAITEFDEMIQPIFREIRRLRTENEKLTTLRDNLLPKLMSGELDVSNLDI